MGNLMTNQELQERLAITKINIAEAGGKIVIKQGVACSEACAATNDAAAKPHA